MYRCRANSPVGAVYSKEATLNVQKNANDFCVDAKEDKLISLPRDCVQQETNESTFNVGKCAPKPCRNQTLDSETSCLDTEYLCCRASAYTVVKVQCTGYELTVPVVQSCTCALCSLQPLTISGVAIGSNTSMPLKRGKVFVNNEFTTYTSTSGRFSASVPTSPDFQSVTLKFEDTFYNTFHDMVKVINIPEASTDDIYISVKLLEKPEPVIMQSDVENTLYGGGENATNSFAAVTKINIPSDSFYYDNGTKYEGNMSVIFTYLLPSDAEGFETAPGVFQFVDSDGGVSQLETLGVFNLQIFDDRKQALTVSEPIDVTMSENLNAIDPETGETMKLWGLNPDTGYWELLPMTQAKRRKRRQGNYLIGQINTGDYYWRNCDIYWGARTCYINPRVYRDASLRTLVDPTNLKLTYLFTRGSSARWTEYEYTGPACTAISCSGNEAVMQLQISTENGYSVLFATTPIENSTHNTLDDARAVKLNMNVDNLNIFDNKATCEAQGVRNSRLSFYVKEFDEEVFTFNNFQFDIPVGTIPDLQTIQELDWKAWCRNLEDGHPIRGDQTKACTIKVAVTGPMSLTSTTVVVRSSMGNAIPEYSGDIIGIREAIPDSSGYACISYRCPTNIVNKPGINNVDETELCIFVATSGSCSVSSVNRNIAGLNDQIGKQQIRLSVSKNNEINSNFGFFKADHQRFTARECQKIEQNAKYACTSSESTPAVTFNCN